MLDDEPSLQEPQSDHQRQEEGETEAHSEQLYFVLFGWLLVGCLVCEVPVAGGGEDGHQDSPLQCAVSVHQSCEGKI